jgi:hypothetical protein
VRRRDAVAGLTTAGLAGLAGCAGLLDWGGGTDAADPAPTAADDADPDPEPSTGDAVDPQSVTLTNATGRERYVTVVVTEPVDGGERVALVRSVRLAPGQRRVYTNAVERAGDYRVVVETADGGRTERGWRVVAGGDGLEATVVDGGFAVWPTVRCGPDCTVATVGRAADLPLVGDGNGYWYAPASVVVRAAGRPRRVDLRVSLRDRTILAAGYELPADTQVRVPLTYRSGRYAVEVSTADGLGARSEWYVPHEPARVVAVGEDLLFGCGAAAPRLRVANGGADARRVDVAVTRPDGTVAYRDGFDLAAGAREVVSAVRDTGRYVVDVDVAGGGTARGVWWACPLHAAVDVTVGARGGATVSQAFREYVADPAAYPWTPGAETRTAVGAGPDGPNADG